MMADLISRQAAIDIVLEYAKRLHEPVGTPEDNEMYSYGRGMLLSIERNLKQLPSAQITLSGYNIKHLELIVRVLQKEDLPPEKIAEVFTDIGRIVAIIKDEFEETLRSVEKGYGV